MNESESTAIIARPQVLPSTAQFAMMRDLAERLSYADGFLPRHFFQGDPATRKHRILAAIEYGRAVGIEPMIALQNITMIDGKAGASALLIGALLRRGGYNIAAEYTANDQACAVTISRQGKVTGRGVFSLENARKAGLMRDGSGWLKYPHDMLYARALTQAARQGAQDAVLGMAYTSEELGLEVDENGQTTGEIPTTQASSESVAALQGAQDERSGTEAGVSPLPAAVQGSVPAMTPSPPPAPATTERSARSVGPRPKRHNVVQAPSAPVAEPTPPATLTEEPVQAPEPVDEGRQVYLDSLRSDLRLQAATLSHLNAIARNHFQHALKGEPAEVVPPPEPNPLSDASLQLLIERDFGKQALDTLEEAQLQKLLEMIPPFIDKRRQQLKEKGIGEE